MRRRGPGTPNRTDMVVEGEFNHFFNYAVAY
jgi:hypothetical protein